ncbi:MAG: glycosyltransferase family 4 protein [Candidatus Parcubacteria bacterium]|nr:glycosyltransferase family 4 protein [Candidatus Parcubacteria bacterium]
MEQKTDKKKILYVITKSNWGGAQRYVFNLATNFAEKYDVSVALGGDGELKTKLQNAGIRTISLPFLRRDFNPFTDILAFKKIVSLFKEEKPDIIHVNSSKIGGLGALAGRIAKVPKIIFTAHGWAFREERPAYQKIIIKFLSWLTILLSHSVITVSERDEREGLAMPFSKGKITLVRNGMEKPEFLSKEKAREAILEQQDLSREKIKNDALWIGTIGELHKNKGHMYAVEAFSKLPKNMNVLFFIIGEGEEKKALQQKIKKSGLEEKIFLLGKRGDASRLLGAFDVFLFPSVKEGLPFAILEAGSAGLPTIASAVGGIPEVITDMETGILIRPKNTDEIIRAIDYVLNHPTKTKDFGKKLQGVIKKDFSLKKMLAETVAVYKE